MTRNRPAPRPTPSLKIRILCHTLPQNQWFIKRMNFLLFSMAAIVGHAREEGKTVSRRSFSHPTGPTHTVASMNSRSLFPLYLSLSLFSDRFLFVQIWKVHRQVDGEKRR